MTTPLDITFRHMAASPLLDEEIRDRVAWLESYHPDIQSCRVVFEVPHRHHRRGRTIWVAVEVGLREGAVHIHHEHPRTAEASSEAIANRLADETSHLEAREAIREAFHIARRRVADAVRRHRAV